MTKATTTMTATTTTIAHAAGGSGGGLDPRFLFLSSSMLRDLPLLREDLLGSVAHTLGLADAGLLRAAEAGALREGLLALLGEGAGALPHEEDIHMAVETVLTQRLGAVAGRLHTGRSRNDQIALDLRLHLREAARRCGALLAEVLEALAGLATANLLTLLPAYTHRQRAIPSTVAHWAMAGGAALLRDAALLEAVLQQLDACPLGAGAVAGSSLPLRREFTAALLGFAAPTLNSIDTVGDRDGAADLAYLSARIHGHLSRIAADVVDFSTPEFGFARLGDDVACGSSMMPHKRNPDVFELVRGRSAQALGAVTAALALTRGLPLGYQRDLQEDRAALTELGPHLMGTLELLLLGLRSLRFDGAAAAQALAGDYTQATDLAEVLVQHGAPFRQAYQAVGALVTRLRLRGAPLGAVDAAELEGLTAALPPAGGPATPQAALAALRARLDPLACVQARGLTGGPAPAAVERQIAAVQAGAQALRARLAQVPSLDALEARLRAARIPEGR